MKKHLLFFTFVLYSFLSCQKNIKHEHSYYYWRTNFSIDSVEKQALQQAEHSFLYTRFFDIDKIKGMYQPVGIIQKNDSIQFSTKTIVPVVFITNRTFINSTEDERKQLAQFVWDGVREIGENFNLKKITEIQLDCDWTAGTRDDFFHFIDELKNISKIDITSTLRLHQVKDKKTMGIPPVSKVYLMCYSTTSPMENSDKNSILDVQLLKNYLHKINDYPIKNITIALPNYSWGIVTNIFGKKRLIHALNTKDLNNNNFRKINENEIEVIENGFYFGHYLNKGFRIKVEEIEEKQRQEVIEFLDKKLQTNYPIIYYHLDSKFIKN